MKLNPLEHDVLEDALCEYAVQLRTIKTPTDLEGQTLTEAAFLASGISEGRRARYLATQDLLQLIRSAPITQITVR